MKGKFKGAVMLAAVLASASVQAEGFAIVGAGTLSCGKYLEARNAKDRITEMTAITWVQGYLSAINSERYMEHDVPMSILPDSASISAFIGKFCDASPQKNVYQAALRLGKEI